MTGTGKNLEKRRGRWMRPGVGLGAVGVLVLTGCGSEPEPEPEPTETAGAEPLPVVREEGALSIAADKAEAEDRQASVELMSDEDLSQTWAEIEDEDMSLVDSPELLGWAGKEILYNTDAERVASAWSPEEAWVVLAPLFTDELSREVFALPDSPQRPGYWDEAFELMNSEPTCRVDSSGYLSVYPGRGQTYSEMVTGDDYVLGSFTHWFSAGPGCSEPGMITPETMTLLQFRLEGEGAETRIAELRSEELPFPEDFEGTSPGEVLEYLNGIYEDEDVPLELFDTVNELPG